MKKTLAKILALTLVLVFAFSPSAIASNVGVSHDTSTYRDVYGEQEDANTGRCEELTVEEWLLFQVDELYFVERTNWDSSSLECCFVCDMNLKNLLDEADEWVLWNYADEGIVWNCTEGLDMDVARGCGQHTWVDDFSRGYYFYPPMQCRAIASCQMTSYQIIMHMRCRFCTARTQRTIRSGVSHSICVR